MLTGGHPHDRWVIEILAGLSKAKKREWTPKRASPLSLAMLSKIITFLESDSMFNETMRTWFSAVCSLSFYGTRKARKTGSEIKFGCFTIRDRKTDHDLLASRTYSLHHLPTNEKAAEALTYLERWFNYAQTKLYHKLLNDDYAFPSLTKIPRGGAKRQRCTETGTPGETFDKVGIKWATPMSDSNFTQVLNIVADAAGVSKNIANQYREALSTDLCLHLISGDGR
ncbi:hypothetical protein JG688_00010101 [Phytophthora aleatoria]|uniref:Uncharacterized protein n=1 Tax=Phytophthora aleatoria TaxID=2496075 RepID=A0A8J5IF44_9STRA|nr:hypothetical protein JG688_00010101 [Phytophthora aleatoria]